MLLTQWLSGISQLTRSQARSSRHRRLPQVQDVLRPSDLAKHADQLERRTLLAAPHPFAPGILNGTNGFRLDGIDADDNSGVSVSSAGDGFDDLMIGAPDAGTGADIILRDADDFVVPGSRDIIIAKLQASRSLTTGSTACEVPAVSC